MTTSLFIWCLVILSTLAFLIFLIVLGTYLTRGRKWTLSFPQAQLKKIFGWIVVITIVCILYWTHTTWWPIVKERFTHKEPVQMQPVVIGRPTRTEMREIDGSGFSNPIAIDTPHFTFATNPDIGIVVRINGDDRRIVFIQQGGDTKLGSGIHMLEFKAEEPSDKAKVYVYIENW